MKAKKCPMIQLFYQEVSLTHIIEYFKQINPLSRTQSLIRLKMQNIQKQAQPIIETQIFDHNLPSELLEQDAIANNHKPTNYLNSDTKYKHTPSTSVLDTNIQSYLIKGKTIFKQTPQYQSLQTISISLPTITAKFPSQGGKGLKSIWESLVGSCKREVYINQGFMYILQRRGAIGYYVEKVWPLQNLFKIFYDKETGKIRFVFVVGHLTETKDFQITQKAPFFNRLRQQIKRMGREM